MPSKIEWTGESWNPIRAVRPELGFVGWHCEHASPGCQNCYAETQNVAQRWDLGTGLPYKPGHRKDVEIWLDEAALVKPLGWKKGRKVFVCSMTDLFADFVPDAMIDRIFAVMALCPQHTFQVLTKRSARMREYLGNPLRAGIVQTVVDNWECEDDCPFGDAHAPWVIDPWPLPNVWLGVSVEDQQRADERIPDLLATPAALRWISAEPLLGPVDLTAITVLEEYLDDVPRIDIMDAPIKKTEAALCGLALINPTTSALRTYPDLAECDVAQTKLDWVVVGGESGSNARPMHPDWARSLRDQCAAAGVPFFFKQWGEFAPGEIAGEFLDPQKPARGFTLFNNQWSECWSEVDGHRDDEPDVYRLGKKRAGRLLDGVLHDDAPGNIDQIGGES